MKHKLINAAVLAAVLPTLATVALAADQDRVRDQDRQPMQDQLQDQTIYGSQLMTDQERMDYRNRMGAAKTDEERTQIRKQHHEQMMARAKERGVSLPDEPRMRGRGMGPGMGMGSGMGGGRR